jgi:hypothetical protein
MSGKSPAGIYRNSEVSRLTSLIESLNDGLNNGLNICGINGPGGIGKTYLVEHVLERIDLEKEGFLYLSVNAADPQKRGDFLGLIEGQLAPRSLPPPARPKTDYFPQIRDIAAIYRDFSHQVAIEMTKKDFSDDLKRLALTLLKTGRLLNRITPKTKEYFDASTLKDTDVTKSVEDFYEQIKNLESLKESTFLPGPIRDLVGTTRKNNVRRDLYGAVADGLITDLSAALTGYRKKDRWKVLHAPIPGMTRLLLLIDDFEVLADTLGDFLIGKLIPQLAAANFTTLILVVGRDDLEASHMGWAQHCRKYIRDEMRIEPLSREAAFQMLREAGIAEERIASVYESTQGFPFLLNLVIEENRNGEGDTALFLRKFFDRTTRWMSEREREWFSKICYLDDVNEDTLRWLFPAEEVPRIQQWFEKDPVRDPTSRTFRVRPLIRDKVLRYQEVRTPSLHRKMLELVREDKAKQQAVEAGH